MQKTTNRRMVTAGMMVAIFLVAIDVTVVGTAMPKIVSELHGINLISWVFAIYTLTTAITTPIYGKLADLFGRKVIFIIGVILFVIGSMLSGAAHSMDQLILFRAFQGLGAGAVMPVTFTIIGDLFPGEQRAKMQGLFSAIWGIAGLIGPLVGGFFVDQLSWHWIFYINLPVGVVTLLLVWGSLHETFEKKDKHIDYWGALTFTVAMSALLYALLNGGQKYAWGSGTIIGLFAIAIVGTVLFLVIESKSREPMLPLSLFKIRVIAVSNLAGFLTSAILIAATVYLPMWIQMVLGHSATTSGLTLTPMSIGWPIGATLAGIFMYKVGSKASAVLGTVLIAGGAGWLTMVSISSSAWSFVGVMVLIGLGMGFATTPFTVLIQSAVGWNLRGAATASSTFTRSLGQTVGIAVYGTWFNHALVTYATAHGQGDWNEQSMNNLLSPGGIAGIPASALNFTHELLAHGLHTVFLAVFGTAILAVVATLFMPLHRTVMKEQTATD